MEAERSDWRDDGAQKMRLQQHGKALIEHKKFWLAAAEKLRWQFWGIGSDDLEEVATGLDPVSVGQEVLTGLLDLFPELRRAVIRVELPSLPAHIVVGAMEIRAVNPFCNL
ncbi:BTB/POZ domain-containing protein [Striga asiatica]|uniref:BTB/POZ domain-containing protein n=1 Tax=Striga asiatica TaxID=4170 RepID=A0A5A7QMA4_STRAF|nr:BTB/POZ domain-containing protein [Striga asiatica]